MKKIVTLLLTLGMLATLLVACGKTDDHLFSTGWSWDENNHWHACVDQDCSEVADKAAHTWDEGEITTPAAKGKDGKKTFTCTVCGYTKTEVVPFVMSRKVADRVYSLIGDEENGVISLSLNADGTMLMLTSHDNDLSLEKSNDDGWGDIAIFEYDDAGKMTGIKIDGETIAITEYDNDGRPTKVGEGENVFTVFTYKETDITFTPDGHSFLTFDSTGRLVKYEVKYEEYSYYYVLGFEGSVGTWEYSEADEDDYYYTVTYENLTRMIQYTENAPDGALEYFWNYEYNETGLPTSVLYVEDPDDAERREGHHYEYEYDAEDRMTKMVAYSVEGTEETKNGEIRYTYAENGKLAKEETILADGSVMSTTIYTYDDKDNLIKEEYVCGNDKSVSEYAYDENGRNVSEIWTKYEDGEMIRKEENRTEYHANGEWSKRVNIDIDYEEGSHFEEIREYREDGELWKRTDITRDADGNAIHEGSTEYYPGGREFKNENFNTFDDGARRSIYEYREDGTRAKETNIDYDADMKKTFEQISEYHADGNQCSKLTTVYYTDGVESSRNVANFDENGNQLPE